MLKKFPVLIFLASQLSSVSAFANHDFSQADELFHQRQDGPSKIKEALNSYKDALTTPLEQHDKIYAIEQSARLLMYHSYIVDQSDTRLRTRISNECLTTLKPIDPNRGFSETPHYYYWRSVCLMARAEAQSSLSESSEIARLIKKGSDVDENYEAAGFERLAGIFYAKLPSFNPFGPSRDLNRAFIHFQRSINSDSYTPLYPVSWKDPSTETGEYFFSTYFYYAEALIKKRRNSAARELIEETLDRLENGDSAQYRTPENLVSKKRMQRLLRRLN